MPTPLQQEYLTISLSQGQSAIVDRDDFEILSKTNWYAHWSPSSKSFYAVRKSPRNGGQGKMVWMHREIMGLAFGDILLVDHINGDSLDNRKANLRFANKAENGRNRKPTGKVKGVTFNRNKKWVAQITVNRKNIYLGSYTSQELAHEAYKEAAARLHGDFASF